MTLEFSPELIFSENPYTDEPYFEHFGEDTYSLYRIVDDRPLAITQYELFKMSVANQYYFVKNPEEVPKAFVDRQSNLRHRNQLINSRFSAEGSMIFSDILDTFLTDLDLVIMPEIFQIEISTCEFISHQEDFVGILMKGTDHFYYYYEYLGDD